MVNAVLMALMLLPLLGTVPWQTGRPDPSTQHEREVAVSPHLGGVSKQLAGREHADPAPYDTQPRHPETFNETDRAAQRTRAIEEQDPALLPVCTDEEWTNRPEPVRPKSFDPWEYPEQLGCRLPPPKPDQGVWGPASQPGPDGAGITAEEFEGQVH